MRPNPPSMIKALGVLLLAALAIGAATGVTGAAGGYTGPGTGGKPTLTIKVKAKQTTKSARKGVRISATCSVPCLVAVNLSRGSKVVGSATKRLPNRVGTLKIKLSKKARRQLRKARKTVKYTLRAGAFNASNRSSNAVVKTVRLKRKK